MARVWVRALAALPLDLGQGHLRHSTAAKRIAFRHVPPPTFNARALDLGCGDGYWSERLRAMGYDVASIDVPRSYPNEDADAEYGRVAYVDVNHALPFSDATFDLIWCSEVIEHLPQVDRAIMEMRRVLRPGGTLILTTPNSFPWYHYLLRVVGMSHRDWQNSGHVQFFSARDIQKRFPTAQMSGYFPYVRWAREVRGMWMVRWLSPSFVIVERRPRG